MDLTERMLSVARIPNGRFISSSVISSNSEFFMRSIFRATAFALLISGVGGVAVAQTPIKIAFVNSQTLMEAAPGRAAATDLLTKEGQGYQTQLQKMQDSIKGLLTKYQKDEP